MGSFFQNRPAIVGMVHVGALPGTPHALKSMYDIIETAVGEAQLYANAGLDGLILENMHDVPYLNGAVGPEIVAAMTAVAVAVRGAIAIPVGVQILAGANLEAVSTAHAAGALFVRVENFVFSHVADEGLMPTAAAGPLLRFRRQIGAEGVKIFADVKKKHSSHSLTADVSLRDTVRAAEFFGADGVIITGGATGAAASTEDLAEAATASKLPVFIGSGVTEENVADYISLADGFLIGSAFKYDGLWSNGVDRKRVASFMTVLGKLGPGTRIAKAK